MGADFKALLFYGMPISGECDYQLVGDFNETSKTLEITNLSPMTGSDFVLFVRESYKSGDEWSNTFCLKLSSIRGKEDEWHQLIVDACAINGLTYTPPDWYFATMFS